LTAGTIKRLVGLVAALSVCLALGGCTSFSYFVSDHWPTWAGGMPNNVPPRPGAPGYEEFIAHQEGRQAQAPAAGSTAPGAVAPAGAPAAPASTGAVVPSAPAAPAAANAYAPVEPAGALQPDNQAAVQGGLY